MHRSGVGRPCGAIGRGLRVGAERLRTRDTRRIFRTMWRLMGMNHAVKMVLACVVLSLGLAAAGSVHADADDARLFLRSQHQGLLKMVRSSKGNTSPELRQRVRKLLDFSAIAQGALGRRWKERTPEEQKLFQSLLTQLVERSYEKSLADMADYAVTYDEAPSKRGERVMVSTKARSKKERRAPAIEVEYAMVRDGKGWVAQDVITDRVSMVRNYRSQFRRILKKDGWDALINKMRDKLNEDQ